MTGGSPPSLLYIAFLLLAGARLVKRLLLPSGPAGIVLAVFLVFLFQTMQSQVTTTLPLASFWVLAAVFAAAAEWLPGGPEKSGDPDVGPERRLMRIGIDGRWFFRGNPSGRVEVRNLTRQLAEHHPEHEYFIFLSRRDRGRPFPWPRPNVHPVFLPEAIGLLSVCILLPWKAAKLGLDACLSFNFPPLAGKFKKIVWINDVIFLEHPEFFTWKEMLYFRPIRLLARLADGICTISRSEMERMARVGFVPGARIAHVPIGSDERYRPAAGHEPGRLRSVRERYRLPERFLLYVGRMNIRKNILHLLKALPLIRDREIKLFLAGKCERKIFDLPAMVAELGLNDRVVLLDEIAEDDLPALYAVATVFCFVSFAEGFGLPPLEAMASGVPVVVSNRDSLPEVCGAAGTYADPDRPEEIAAAIDSLLGDPLLRARKREQGLERARMFTWRESAEKLLQLIRETVR